MNNLTFNMIADDGGWKGIIVDTLAWRGLVYKQAVARGVVWTADAGGTFTCNREAAEGRISYVGEDSNKEAPYIFIMEMRSVYGHHVKQRARVSDLKQILDMASRVVVPMESAIKNYEKLSSTFGTGFDHGKAKG
jgi:hypothetical protein